MGPLKVMDKEKRCIRKVIPFPWYISCLAGIMLSVNTGQADDHIKMKGNLNTGLTYTNRNYHHDSGNIYDEEVCPVLVGKLLLKVRVNNQIYGKVHVEGDCNEPQINLKAVALSYEINDRYLLTTGNLKKKFGIEESMSSYDLMTFERSYYNAFISSFNILGRELGLRLRYDNSGPLCISGAVYGNNSDIVTANSHIKYEMDDRTAGFGVLYAYRRKASDYWLCEYDYSMTGKKMYCDFEVSAGQNPCESNIHTLLGLYQPVHFIAAKSLVSYQVDTGTGLDFLEPLCSVTYIIPDLRVMDCNIIQALAGLNVYLHPRFRIQINGDLVFSNHEFSNEMALLESRIRINTQLRWKVKNGKE